MKVGIISDIHSNIYALEAVLNRFKEEKIDGILCLGDTIGIGPYPEKCIELMLNNKEMFLGWIRGNHENYLLRELPKREHNKPDGRLLTEYDLSFHKWNNERLNKQQVDFLSTLDDSKMININGKNILLQHYPFDNVNNGVVFKKFSLEPSPELFNNKNADIYLFGHTHKPFYNEVNGKYYINPGSLGCLMNSKGANVGILQIENNILNYKQLIIEYNVEKLVKEIKQLNYPKSDRMIEEFFTVRS